MNKAVGTFLYKALCEHVFIPLGKIPKSGYSFYFQMNIHTHKIIYENYMYERTYNSY